MIISKETFNKHWSETVNVVAYSLREYEKRYTPLTTDTVQKVIDREIKQKRWLTKDVPHQFHTWLYEFGLNHPTEAETIKQMIDAVTVKGTRSEASPLLVPAAGAAAAAGGIGVLALGKLAAGCIITSAGVAAAAVGMLAIPKINIRIIKEVRKYLTVKGQEIEKIIEKFE